MVKTVSDYVALVQERYPMFSWTEVYKILNHGLKTYALVNRMHCDVAIYNRKPNEIASIYCNTRFHPWLVLKHYKYWKHKWRMKERALYKLKKIKWDGYYYIGLCDEAQHKSFLRQRNKKYKTIKDVYLVKVLKEFHHEKYIKWVWRVKWPTDCGWKFYIDKVTIEDLEYVGENNYEDYHQCFLGRYDAGSGTVIYPANSPYRRTECDVPDIQRERGDSTE